jgi:hypothetical protein
MEQFKFSLGEREHNMRNVEDHYSVPYLGDHQFKCEVGISVRVTSYKSPALSSPSYYFH